MDSSNFRVLLVEDDLVSQTLMRRLVDRSGYPCIGYTGNGPEAVDMALRDRPEIILMDINILGGITGIEAARRINEVYAPAVIYVTALADGDLDGLYETMPYGYVRKPVDYSQVKVTLDLAAQRLSATRKDATGQQAAHSVLLEFLRGLDVGEVGLDGRGRVLRLNAKAEQLLGESAEQINGRLAWDTGLARSSVFGSVPADDHPCIDAARTQVPVFDVPLAGKKDGPELIGSFLPQPGTPDDPCRVVVLLKEARRKGETTPLQDMVMAEMRDSFESTQYDYDKASAMIKQIQQHAPAKPDWVSHVSIPVKSVGGDLLLVSRGAEEQVWNFFLGDSTGHALHSAMGLLPAIFGFYGMAEQGKPLAHMVRTLNDRIKENLPTDVFVCAVLAQVDLKRNLLHIWNAGCPPVVIASAGGVRERVHSDGLPLGILASSSYSVELQTFPLKPADRIYITTDGITETENEQGEMFGEEGLAKIVGNDRGDAPRLEDVMAALRAFQGQAPQQDDLSLVELRIPDAHKPAEASCVMPSLPWSWRLTLELDAEALRTGDFRQIIMDMILKAHDDLVRVKEELFMVISELYSNAVSHGLLRLESSLRADPDAYHQLWLERLSQARGWIRIDLKLMACAEDRHLEIRVEDSGPGFDFANAATEIDDPTVISGRGVLLLRALCRDLRYEEPGNKVVAVYAW